MAYFLGMDGGGSKTACVIGDESSVVAAVTSGPSNITRVGEKGARESLHRAIHEACAAAKIDPRELQCACIGAAGAGRAEVDRIVQQIVAEVIDGEIEVVGDMAIALQAAFGNGPGVIVVAGTGSIAYGRNPQAITARAGGWGFAVSDEGSAYWIGRTAVAKLLRAIDERTDQEKDVDSVAESCSLFRELKNAWKLQSFDEFVRTGNSSPEFAAILPAVIAAADDGDVVAQNVLAQAGCELAQLAAIVVRRLFAPEAGLNSIPIAMVGGVFRHSRRVREAFSAELRALDSRIEVNPEIIDPVIGALQMARKAGKKLERKR